MTALGSDRKGVDSNGARGDLCNTNHTSIFGSIRRQNPSLQEIEQVSSRYPYAMLRHDSIIVAASRGLSSDLGSETIVLDTNTHNYWGLNRVTARIWHLVQEPRSFSQVVAALQEQFDVSREQCEREVRDILVEMEENGLVVIERSTTGGRGR
jgi:hypothetical protein